MRRDDDEWDKDNDHSYNFVYGYCDNNVNDVCDGGDDNNENDHDGDSDYNCEYVVVANDCNHDDDDDDDDNII